MADRTREPAKPAATTTTTTTTTTVEGHYWERCRRTALPWVVGALGLTALGIGQLVPTRLHMEDDLTARSRTALAAAGLPGVQVDFTGRDGTLSGAVTSAADAERALAVVRGLEGVRVATAELSYPGSGGAGTTTAALPAVDATTSGGVLTLTGTVGSQAAREALVAAAVATYGADHVVDRLTVAPGSSDAGLDRFATVVSALGNGSAATASLARGELSLSGTVADAATVTALGTTAAAVVGDPAKVHNGLTAGPAPSTAPTASAAPTTAPAPSTPAAAPATTPAPAATSAPAQVEQQLVQLPQITFVTGSATLTPSGRRIVDQAATILKANPTLTVKIAGYTDDLGDWDVNLGLSAARANTVRLTLIADGIAAGRLSSAGYSEDFPKVPNTSAANRALNRRVEFHVNA